MAITAQVVSAWLTGKVSHIRNAILPLRVVMASIATGSTLPVKLKQLFSVAERC